MDNFRHIDTIRRPDGKLRSWEEHDELVHIEYMLRCDGYNSDYYAKAKHRFLDEERSRFQKGL